MNVVPQSDRLAYRLQEAANHLGVSRTTLWRRIASGDIPTRKIGGVVVIPGDALRALVEWEGKPKTTQKGNEVVQPVTLRSAHSSGGGSPASVSDGVKHRNRPARGERPKIVTG